MKKLIFHLLLIKCILLDEFQDVNNIEWELVQTIIKKQET